MSSAPDLPATILSEHCYEGMFSNCTTLTATPTLVAESNAIVPYCYKDMFSGCKALHLVTTELDSFPDELGAFVNWLSDVKNDEEGEFRWDGPLSESRPNEIPSQWKITKIHPLGLSAELLSVVKEISEIDENNIINYTEQVKPS